MPLSNCVVYVNLCSHDWWVTEVKNTRKWAKQVLLFSLSTSIDSQKIIREGSKLQRRMPWGNPREYQKKERIKNVTIRQQNGLEETIVKEIEQNQLTWYGHIQRMVEGRLPKIALKWIPKQKRARGRPKKN